MKIQNLNNPNPFTGYHSPGLRFRLNCRAISHTPLYLPIAMKNLPQILNLKNGVSPLDVFGASDIKVARRAFNNLREQFDFTFWAARNYHIRDINDPDKIVPYFLPDKLAPMIHTFLVRYHEKKLGRYVITKKYGRIGLTTCIQAYVLWRQVRSSYKGVAAVFADSSYALRPLKINFCRHFDKNPTDAKRIHFPVRIGSTTQLAWISSIFNSLKNPDGVRGIDIDFVHFADMAKWHDKDLINSYRAKTVCLGTVLIDYRTLFIMEGDLPSDFPDSPSDLYEYSERKVYNEYAHPSLLLKEATYAAMHPLTTHYHHIKI